MITSGDFDTRHDICYLQKWYTQALKMSVGQVRESIGQVKLSELEGFAVAPITRPFENDDDNNNATLSEALEPDTPQLPPEVKGYDDAGFYIGDDDDDKDEDMMKEEYDGEATTEAYPSWADEVEDAIAEMSRSNSSASESDDSSSSSEQCSDPSTHVQQDSLNTDDELEDGPLSDELRCLLLEISGDPETTRSETRITLTNAESDDVRRDWFKALADVKDRDARRRRFRGESWAESDLLDKWDPAQGRFHWQTEGLFLCRLTELVYKDIFEQARKVFWADVKVAAAREDRRRRPKLPSSPLKTEFHL